jgi:hypothetical protein
LACLEIENDYKLKLEKWLAYLLENNVYVSNPPNKRQLPPSVGFGPFPEELSPQPSPSSKHQVSPCCIERYIRVQSIDTVKHG